MMLWLWGFLLSVISAAMLLGAMVAFTSIYGSSVTGEGVRSAPYSYGLLIMNVLSLVLLCLMLINAWRRKNPDMQAIVIVSAFLIVDILSLVFLVNFDSLVADGRLIVSADGLSGIYQSATMIFTAVTIAVFLGCMVKRQEKSGIDAYFSPVSDDVFRTR